MATCLVCLLAAMLLTGCDRAMLRRVIDMLGHRDKSKPAVYHDYEGYSPGLRKSHVTEEFSRYHYYIAPDEVAAPDPVRTTTTWCLRCRSTRNNTGATIP